MKIYFGLPNIKGKSIVVLGLFDGVHIGHRALIESAIDLSKKELLPVILCTFNKRPIEVLDSSVKPNYLTSLQQRALVVASLGVDAMCITNFNKELSQKSPEEFIENLCTNLKPAYIFSGYNYTFGKGGQGNNEMLKILGVKYNYKTHIKSRVEYNHGSVSSTKIRELILNGNVKLANELLKYRYTMPLKLSYINKNELHFSFNSKKTIPKKGMYSAILTIKNNKEHMSYNILCLVLNNKCIAIIEEKEKLPQIYVSCNIAISFIARLKPKVLS